MFLFYVTRQLSSFTKTVHMIVGFIMRKKCAMYQTRYSVFYARVNFPNATPGCTAIKRAVIIYLSRFDTNPKIMCIQIFAPLLMSSLGNTALLSHKWWLLPNSRVYIPNVGLIFQVRLTHLWSHFFYNNAFPYRL